MKLPKFDFKAFLKNLPFTFSSGLVGMMIFQLILGDQTGGSWVNYLVGFLLGFMGYFVLKGVGSMIRKIVEDERGISET